MPAIVLVVPLNTTSYPCAAVTNPVADVIVVLSLKVIAPVVFVKTTAAEFKVEEKVVPPEFVIIKVPRAEPLPTAPVTEIVPVPGFNVKCLPAPAILLPKVILLLDSVAKVKVVLLDKVTAPSYRW